MTMLVGTSECVTAFPDRLLLLLPLLPCLQPHPFVACRCDPSYSPHASPCSRRNTNSQPWAPLSTQRTLGGTATGSASYRIEMARVSPIQKHIDRRRSRPSHHSLDHGSSSTFQHLAHHCPPVHRLLEVGVRAQQVWAPLAVWAARVA